MNHSWQALTAANCGKRLLRALKHAMLEQPACNLHDFPFCHGHQIRNALLGDEQSDHRPGRPGI
jgi:hypothetical protein